MMMMVMVMIIMMNDDDGDGDDGDDRNEKDVIFFSLSRASHSKLDAGPEIL